jgi:hypothetical protein
VIEFARPVRQDASPSTSDLFAMIEYIFFDAALRDKFVSYAEQRDVPCTASDDSMGLLVAIPEDLPDDVADDMEEYYDVLETEQADLSKMEGDLKQLAGFRFNLPDGQSRMLPLQTEIASRLLASFNLEEIQALFDAVAECTLNPNDEHLCKILDAQGKKD